MEVDFCRERLRVGMDLWELWLYVGDLVLDFVAMVVVVFGWGCGKVQGGDPTAGLASMNPFVCFCGGFTERNGHKKCHERKVGRGGEVGLVFLSFKCSCFCLSPCRF